LIQESKGWDISRNTTILPYLVALLEENKKFKQQLKIAEMEKEFLKKAATDVSCFFSTPQ
jgi:hypothetical protein